MSFETPQSVPTGSQQHVLEVDGRPPTGLQDFVGDELALTVGQDLQYRIEGSGRMTDDLVRFHQKDVINGKDVRVWHVTQQEGTFFAEPAPTF